ncbi:KH domain-containing protein [Edaphobacter albus]|uniref:KH domain-containing protein n=1 Tax=Edaphobacter sp. 4G125 TaxID=2763071 RepID=UPI001646D27F|nr:KH domain-containing protein [Edaphobacter sp. 4G125]QNI35658.1 KH domain-containing protein [Edaphobacter sp. 4G125]
MTQSTQRTGEANSANANIVGLVIEIARALVDSPEAVSIETVEEEDATVIRLRVAPGDIGKIIGKQGRTARSLRTILTAASMKVKHRFALDIIEDSAPQV